MCSRYEAKIPVETMIERFGLSVPDFTFPGRTLDGDIRPTNQAIVIAPDATPLLLSWGLCVSWQKQPVINARAETVGEKPTFGGLLEQRVLIPASAYFEWRRDSSRKIKTRIAPDNDDILTMAGLRDGERFVMLTCAPASNVAHIHNRMPVIFGRDAANAWLNPDVPFADLADSLCPNSGPFEISEPEDARKPAASAQQSLFD